MGYRYLLGLSIVLSLIHPAQSSAMNLSSAVNQSVEQLEEQVAEFKAEIAKAEKEVFKGKVYYRVGIAGTAIVGLFSIVAPIHGTVRGIQLAKESRAQYEAQMSSKAFPEGNRNIPETIKSARKILNGKKPLYTNIMDVYAKSIVFEAKARKTLAQLGKSPAEIEASLKSIRASADLRVLEVKYAEALPKLQEARSAYIKTGVHRALNGVLLGAIGAAGTLSAYVGTKSSENYITVSEAEKQRLEAELGELEKNIQILKGVSLN